MNKIVEYFNGLKAKINLKIKHKKAIITVTAFVLAICILVSVISFVKSFKTPEMFESDARIVVDCGIRVGFVVDENFIVSEVFACEKKYEKYIEDIRYESDFVKAITHVFNHAQAENYVYNVDYFAVLASIETKNPKMYEMAQVWIHDEVMVRIGMEQIYYCGVAITEYDPKIQRLANRNKVPYSVAYVCLELEKANEGLSAKKLMKEELYIISQLANNANGKNRNYFWSFTDEISRKNLANV